MGYVENSEKSEQLKKALYYELKKKGYHLQGGYINATEKEDKYDKIDVYYRIDNKLLAVQLRSYDSKFYKDGFPVRDAKLQNENEMERLLAGKLDDVMFVFAEAVETTQGKYSFRKMKMVLGKELRLGEIIAERSFADGNHVSYIRDPPTTIHLR